MNQGSIMVAVLVGLSSATIHDAHHQQLNQNFGLYLTVWDRVLKTDRAKVAVRV